MTYSTKRFLIDILLYGGCFATIMLIMEDQRSVFSFLFLFFSYGIFMALFNRWMTKKSLQSIGITDVNEITGDEQQVRTISLSSSWDGLKASLLHDRTYEILRDEDNEMILQKKYYTTEFIQKVKLEKMESSGITNVKVSNIPKKVTKNDLALCHRVVNDMVSHLEKLDNRFKEEAA